MGPSAIHSLKVLYGMGSRTHGEEPTAEEMKMFQAWRSDFQKQLRLLGAAIE